MLKLMILIGQTTPGPVIDPQAATGGLIDSIGASALGAAIGFGLLLVVFIGQRVYNHLKDDPVNTDWLPWFACGLAAVGAAATGLVEEAKLLDVIWAAVSAWITAMGEYQVLKHAGRTVKKAIKKVNGG